MHIIQDQCVSFAAKQGLINALQSRQKVTKLDEKPSAITEEEKNDNKKVCTGEIFKCRPSTVFLAMNLSFKAFLTF